MKRPGSIQYPIHLVYFAFFAVFFAGCASEQTKTEEETAVIPEKKVTVPEPGSYQGDTISLSGRYVLFFAPELLAGQPDKLDPAIFESYKQTAGLLMDSLKAVPGLKSSFTTARFFRIYGAGGNSMVISKSAIENETGVLVTDGNQPPSIKKGILNPDGYHELFRNYFFLK